MKKNTQAIQSMAITALLCALGIMIPMVLPKIVIPPMSFTLASHVPIFIAMFISPVSAIATTLITSVGFLLSLPIVVALRALSHIFFVVVGCLMLKKFANLLQSPKTAIPYGLLLSLLHAVSETLVVTFFYFGGGADDSWYQSGYIVAVLLLVGVGTFVHSMIDFGLAVAVWKPIQSVLRIPVAAPMRRKEKAA